MINSFYIERLFQVFTLRNIYRFVNLLIILQILTSFFKRKIHYLDSMNIHRLKNVFKSKTVAFIKDSCKRFYKTE